MRPALVLLRASSYISASVFTASAASGTAPSVLTILSLDSVLFILCHRQSSKALRIAPRRDAAQALSCSTLSPLPFWVSGWYDRHIFVADILHPGRFMSVFFKSMSEVFLFGHFPYAGRRPNLGAESQYRLSPPGFLTDLGIYFRMDSGPADLVTLWIAACLQVHVWPLQAGNLVKSE